MGKTLFRRSSLRGASCKIGLSALAGTFRSLQSKTIASARLILLAAAINPGPGWRKEFLEVSGQVLLQPVDLE